MQAEVGVSLEAQREKLMQYCKLYDIELVETYLDDLSGKSLERPGLQSALKLLEKGKANALVVCKLDRLTRSLRDLDMLVQRYFVGDRFSLLSVSESIDTRTASGRLVMNVLGMFAQWEREAISERTREALDHLRATGVHIGAIEYGRRRIEETDAEGRRLIVDNPAAQKIIVEILAQFDQGMKARAIGRELNSRGIEGPRGPTWNTNAVLSILERNGRQVRRPRVKREYQPDRALNIARQLREQERSLRFIGRRLEAAGLKPRFGGRWHASSVAALLESETTSDITACRRRARQLRAEGLSLRMIGSRLLDEGYMPPRAAFWHATAVVGLLQ